MKLITEYVYAGSTRPVRVLNFILSTVWFLVAVFFLTKYLVVLPKGILHNLPVILTLAGVTSVLSFLSLFKIQYDSFYKCVSLHTGALLQAMIGVGYTNSYPSLEVASIITFMLALWLIGAAYFVMYQDLETEESTNANDSTNRGFAGIITNK